jgi:hypothetical protein
MRNAMLTLAVSLAIAAGSATGPSAEMLAPVRVGPSFASMGPLSFGPDGTLYAADRQAASIYALDLGAAASAAAPGAGDIAAIDQKIAARLGTAATEVAITDLAIHPTSRNAYLSVMRGQGPNAQAALIRVDGTGNVEVVSLDTVSYTSVSMPNPPAANATGRNGRMASITDMAYLDGHLYVAGLSNEEFASKFWAVPYPFRAADRGTSVEIWHASHARFETNSPILTFVPMRVANEPTLIAGYTCTPLVRFPVSDMKPGAKIMGTTIAELGSGNQPIDMVLYEKDSRQYLLMANTRHGVLKIATEPFGRAAGLTERVEDTAGVPAERVASMAGVVQLDLLDGTRSIALQRTDAAINLQTFSLQ